MIIFSISALFMSPTITIACKCLLGKIKTIIKTNKKIIKEYSWGEQYNKAELWLEEINKKLKASFYI